LDTPLAGAAYHGLGLLAGADADYPQAIEMLAEARQRDPTDVVVLSDLGYALLRAGRPAQARVPLMQASQLQPDQPQVQANLALYLFATRRGNEAEQLMSARNLPPGTRHAIRQAARDLPATPVARPAGSRTADESPP
ncbi:MAG TPA: tetratricopeptide repeat protein, partial [Variovorax sp.]|nr:tetratricopeptide repeat protein [Variovorax sp.]